MTAGSQAVAELMCDNSNAANEAQPPKHSHHCDPIPPLECLESFSCPGSLITFLGYHCVVLTLTVTGESLLRSHPPCETSMATGVKDEDASFELEPISNERNRPSSHRPNRSSFSSTSDNSFDDSAEQRGLDSSVLYTVEERAIFKKLDQRLVLFIALLDMLSFLARSSKFAALI